MKKLVRYNLSYLLLTIIMIMIIDMPPGSLISSSPPEDPIKCSNGTTNCTITNSIGTFPDRTTCRAAKAIFPRSEAELVSAVANATIGRRKIKVTTRYSHSIPKLACPDGEDGILISTKYLNRMLEVDVPGLSMTVESGMTLRQVTEEAAVRGMALPYSPYWWGLTVGGMMATGAHGSSLWGAGSQVHDYVTQLRIVTPAEPSEGYAKVRTLENGDPEMDAVKVSLGVLGVISQVNLKLQPQFKRSVTFVTKSDWDLGDEALRFGRQHEFGDLIWYPSQNMVVYRIDDRISSNVSSAKGLNDFQGFRSTTSLVAATIRNSEETQEFLGDAQGKCLNGILTTSTLKTFAYGYTNNGILFTGYPIIGDQNRIQASGSCLDSFEDARITICPWDHRVKGLFYHQTTFTVALSRVKDFIEDVQKIVALEPKSLCGLDLYNGILMRYVTYSSAYLGKQEDGLDFDITYYRSKDPLTPRLYGNILEEIEQMALFKYNALPHWGKNRNVAFRGVIGKYDKASEFLKVKQLYDPMGLFSSEWTDQILGLKDGLSISKEGCALEGLCICSQDIHCSPGKRYFCRPGKYYQDARVCALQPNKLASKLE